MKRLTLITSVALCANLSFAQNTWDVTNGTATTNGNISTTNGTITATNGNVIVTNGVLGLGSPDNTTKLNISTNSNTITSGITNNLTNTSASTLYGFRNTLNYTGNGIKYGIYNSLYATTTTDAYGQYSLVQGTSNGNRYGIYSNVNVTGTGSKFGMWTKAVNTGSNNSSTNATAFGIYAEGTGANSRAGYFKGDVEIASGNTIYAAANGSKTLFLANGGTGDYAFTIVPNLTNFAYDWDWTKTFVLKRSGEMIKTVSSDDKAFTIARAGASDVFRVYGNGKVYATEVNVRVATDFPDYVFTPSYKLMPLQEVHNFIIANGHLPNVPTAQTVAKEGVNVGEMTTLLVEKVEELTLYMIAQQTSSENMKALIETQQAEIEVLKAALAELNK